MAEAENKDQEQKDKEKPTLDGDKAAQAPITPAEAKPPRQPVNVTISDIELEQLKKEANEFKDKYLRGLAEAENARKRLQKERQELTQYAVQNAIVDFLNPIDHFENALNFTQQASDEVKHWAIGFQMILNQFKDVLASNNVTAVKSVGTHFDPHYHEAVEMVTTTDYPPGTVIEESLKGYKMGDRTIRPARVKVSKAPQPVSKEEKQPDDKNKNDNHQNNKVEQK